MINERKISLFLDIPFSFNPCDEAHDREHQTISSPNYQSVRESMEGCQWTINALNGQRIRIELNPNFELDHFDVLKVYDGTTDKKEIARIDGINGISEFLANEIKSSSNELQVIHTSKGINEKQRFEIKYRYEGKCNK